MTERKHAGSPGASADALLRELGESIGIPALELDASGGCQLAFDGRWLVTLIHAPAVHRWILSCPLAAAHAPVTSGTQGAMLRASFMGAGCGGGALSLAPDGRPSLQYQLAHSECNAPALLAQIESLLNQAEIWAERIQRGETAPANAQGIPAGNPLHRLADGERPPDWMLGRI